MKSKEIYFPSEEEKLKAESMLSANQRYQSEQRLRRLKDVSGGVLTVQENPLKNKLITLRVNEHNHLEQIKTVLRFLKKQRLYKKGALYRGANIGELKIYQNPETKIFASTEEEMLDQSFDSESAWRYVHDHERDGVLIVFDEKKMQTDTDTARGDYSYSLKPGETFENAILAVVKFI
jgi:cobalamin biosynthesis Mg chelatase CobN